MGWVMSKSGMDALKNIHHQDPQIRDKALRTVEIELKSYLSYKAEMRRGLFGRIFGGFLHSKRNEKRWEHFSPGEPEGKLMVNERLIGKGQEDGKA